MKRTNDLRELFLTQGKVSKKHTDRSCASVHEQFCQTLDRIMQAKVENEVFPRMSSQAANDRIERLVRGLEESADLHAVSTRAQLDTTPPKDDETIIEPPRAASSPARPNRKVSARFFINACEYGACNKSRHAHAQPKNADDMNRLADAPEFVEPDNDRDGLTEEQQDTLDEHNSINLEDESDKERNYDEDEEEDEAGDEFWSSDSGEYDEAGEDDDDGEARAAATAKDGAAADATSSSDDEDFDANDDGADEDDKPVKQPPAKKARVVAASNKGVNAIVASAESAASAKKKSLPRKKGSNNKEMAAFKKQQAELKRKRTADTKDVDAVEAVMNDYLYVAAIQAMGIERDFRKLLLGSPASTNKDMVRIAHSLQVVEAQVAESLLLANKAMPDMMREINDFVKGATEIRTGKEAHAKAAQRCDITQTPAASAGTLISLEACHKTKKDGAETLLWKRKVVREDIRDLIEAVWFAVNLLPITETMVAERLTSMRDFENGKTMAAAAIRMLQEEKTEKKRLRSVLRKKLATALGKIDLSTKILDK